ncbi:short-chain dehydrogenase reductase family [Fusarium agapanthi]|uniref:Short-chain dehydrogenase reductase family n=1 Tax=Fusarium agapanthi TaxID=1803897 RepID=A0A9P5BEM3_9HYPO|nr:short-chain dehydrogenase reductase family [Fusarium agapanthi]
MHNIPFLATGARHGYTTTLGDLQNGLAIDLSHFKEFELDVDAKTLSIGPGVTVGEIFDPLFNAGFVIQTGSAPCPSFIGVTLGGGVGRFQGVYGLLSDALISVRLITANGEVVEVSRSSYPDLFWAIRGAGANFGVVVSATYSVHPLTNNGDMFVAEFIVPPRRWSEYFLKTESMSPLPAELSSLLLNSFNMSTNQTQLYAHWAYKGHETEARKHLSPILNMNLTSTQMRVLPWNKLMENTFAGAAVTVCQPNTNRDLYTLSIRNYSASTWEAVSSKLANFYARYPQARSSSLLYEFFPNQAMAAIPLDETAFPRRDTTAYINLILTSSIHNSEMDNALARFGEDIRRDVAATSGYSEITTFVNYAHGDETLEQIYGKEKLARLAALKKTWDPNEVFSFNNGLPTSSTTHQSCPRSLRKPGPLLTTAIAQMSAKLEHEAAFEATFRGWLSRQFTTPKPLPGTLELKEKTAIITGSNTGLGFEASRQLLELGLSHLIMAVRSQAKGDAVASTLRAEFPDSTVSVWILDMESYDSVAAFATQCDTLSRIDIVILNAALIKPSFSRASTGHELTMQVAYLSTALLTILLLPIIKAKKTGAGTRPPVITVVGSDLAFRAAIRTTGPVLEQLDKDKGYSQFVWYARSKLLLTFFLSKLAEFIDPDHVLLNVVNPGTTRGTAFLREFSPILARLAGALQYIFARPVDIAATTYLDACLLHGIESHGSFISDWNIKPYPSIWYTSAGEVFKKRLWEETMREFEPFGVYGKHPFLLPRYSVLNSSETFPLIFHDFTNIFPTDPLTSSSIMARPKFALVTGCGRGGIGEALVMEYKRLSFHAIATILPHESRNHLSQAGITCFPLDVTVEDSISELKTKVQELTGGRLHILVNCAGIAYTMTTIDTDVIAVQRMFDVNVFGPMRMVYHFHDMVIKGSGTIVNIGSIGGTIPFVYGSSYNASKAALQHWSNTLRVEMAPFKRLPEGSYYSALAKEFEQHVLRKPKNATDRLELAENVVKESLKNHPSAWFWFGSFSTLTRFLDTFAWRTIWVGLIQCILYRPS